MAHGRRIMSRYEIPPERLGRWLDRWAAANGPVERTLGGVRFEAGAAAIECASPFPPVEAPAEVEGYSPEPLLAHVAIERRVGVLLVRLGGAAAGVFHGRELVDSKIETRLVHGRNRKGGSSSGRFARRREGQARVARQAAADAAVRVIVPVVAELDAVVLGGDRRALAIVLADARLTGVRALAVQRVMEVPDPRLDVLRGTPNLFLTTEVRETSGR
jgi:hypothetical protein